MILFQDGTVLLLRRGHIKSEFFLDQNIQITLNRQNRFTMKTVSGGGPTEVVECAGAEEWVSILKSIQNLLTQKKEVY